MNDTVSCNRVHDFSTDLNLPFAGYRENNSIQPRAEGSKGVYWSSSHYNSDSAYRMYFEASTINPGNAYSRASGLSVRCFKNSSTHTLSFYRYGKIEKTINRKRFEHINLSDKPAAPYGTTENWYTDPAKTKLFAFGDTSSITQDTTLYSKITCNDSTKQWNGDECVKETTSWIEGEDFFPLVVTGSDGSEVFTIMDRNL